MAQRPEKTTTALLIDLHRTKIKLLLLGQREESMVLLLSRQMAQKHNFVDASGVPLVHSVAGIRFRVDPIVPRDEWFVITEDPENLQGGET